jgi:serine/threonine protein kinase/formylglycine-generating enzyme required for sulfatase activity/Tol biopolymer transport system component
MDEQSIFLTALEQESPAARTAYLDSACGGDADLRRRIVALLSRHDDAGSFLERAPGELDATAVGIDDTHEDRDPNSDARTTLYDSSDDVALDFLHPSSKAGCLGTIGQYEVQSVIGRGGMGVVLKAHDTKLHRTVAVKVLAPELAANPTAKQRFVREARAAAAVTNPHVVTTHAVDEDRVPYIVMELVDGKTLREKIDAVGMMGVKEILRIGSQIAHGLAAAHKQGLIHRDIKPGNILLENGVERVKITDFGLARAVDDMSVTRTGEVAGTPQYMSPEQALGEGVDHRSDLFSLGSVLYAMCTGRPPFRGDNAMAVLRRVIDEAPRPIREVNAEIPEWLCDIIDKLLAKKLEERYQTAKEVAGVLEESLARLQYPSHGTSAPSSSPAPADTASRTFSKRQWLVTAGVVGVLLVAAGIIIKITQPDGTTVEIAADSGSRIEISSDDDSETDDLRDHSHSDDHEHSHSDDEAHIHEHEAEEDDAFPITQQEPTEVVPVDFNGTWDSFWGPVTFTHSQVTGEMHGDYVSHSDRGEGQIQGTVDPATRTFRGSFLEAEQSGRLLLVLSADGQSIEGWYDNLDEPLDFSRPLNEWNLTRQLSAVDFNGLWDSRWGEVTLRHAPVEGIDHVEMRGEYRTAGSDNSMEGYIDPTTRMFKGRFFEAATSGRIWLELSRTGRAIQGWYDYGDAPVEGERPFLPWDMTLNTRLAPLDAEEQPNAMAYPPGSSANILTSPDWEWTEPENLGRIFNSPENEGGPSLTADGLTLVFHSQSLTTGEDDLWIATRGSTDQAWTASTSLGPGINSTQRDANPSISADGLVLVFESDRAGGLGDRDLWITSRLSRDDNWDTPVNLGEFVNSDSFDQGPALSPDGLSLVFATGRGGGEAELWESIRPTREAPWSPARRLEGGINSPAYQSWPAVAGDGLSLVFNSNRDGGPTPGPLWISTRSSTTEAWGAPVRLASAPNWVTSVCLNGDGSIMLFDSPRSGGHGRYDLWMTRRVPRDSTAMASPPGLGKSAEILTSHEWEWTEPENLGPAINSEASEGGATLSADGLTLVFDSDRVDGFGQFDLWSSDRESVDSEWGIPMNLGTTINSANHDATPSLSADGLSLVFASDRPGGFGDQDLWMTIRPSLEEPWSAPVNLGEHVNSSGRESNPALSADGLKLVFMSPREGDFELWETSRPTMDAPWQPPRRLGIQGRGDATFASDGLSLVYNVDVADRSPDETPLWIATRSSVGGEWSTTRLPVNYPYHEFDTSPCLSNDHVQLLFTSHRPGGQGGFDIWMIRRVLRPPAAADSQDEEATPPMAIAPFDADEAREHQKAWAEYLGVPVEYENSIGTKFVLIPPGEFMMGSTAEDIEALISELTESGNPPSDHWEVPILRSETPQRRVTIREPFYMSAYETRVGEFREFVIATGYETTAELTGGGVMWNEETMVFDKIPENVWSNPHHALGENHPLVFITETDAAAFCDWLKEREGRNYSLPSESQWEFACRAGTVTRWSFGDDESESVRFGWTLENLDIYFNPVARLAPNPFSLYDMHGNVAELTLSPQGQPVERGGMFGRDAAYARSASRSETAENEAWNGRGFRLVLSVDATQDDPE